MLSLGTMGLRRREKDWQRELVEWTHYSTIPGTDLTTCGLSSQAAVEV